MASVDYSGLGLKVGIEVHQQLDTIHKMFCDCPTNLDSEKVDVALTRRLRPTQSELGELDPAALFEFAKGRAIRYEGSIGSTCLVESDEEPPHQLNDETVAIGLEIALLLGARPVEELHVMRKIVVDGSNTGGFQRTSIIALGGSITVDGREIGVQTITLEEDAARKVRDEGSTSVYRLDRLGIPLIEIATSPNIRSPQEAAKSALALGRILRATKKVRRGLGTIRQDLNISVKDGGLIEVKGVQKLEQISKVVDFEVGRQVTLLRIRDELRTRGVSPNDLTDQVTDITSVFKDSSSKLIKNTLAKGGTVLGLRLAKFGGVLKTEIEPNVRLGTEMSEHAKFWGKVGGIFHTDELPGFGISNEETARIRTMLSLSETDAGVLVADDFDRGKQALKAVVERAREACIGVPAETRAANPDGTTRYLRPRPGAARMYPETDVPPIVITHQRIRDTQARLPPSLEEQLAVFMKNYSLNEKLAQQVLDSEYLPLFEKIVVETGLTQSFVATALTEMMKSLDRDHVPIDNLPYDSIFESFQLICEGSIAKEAWPDIVRTAAKDNMSPSAAVQKLGLKMLTQDEIAKVVEEKLSKNFETISGEPKREFEALMKLVMSEVRGRADSALVSQIVNARLVERKYT